MSAIHALTGLDRPVPLVRLGYDCMLPVLVSITLHTAMHCRSGDGRYAVLVIAKAEPSHTWRCLFQGDTDGFRSTSSGGPTRAQHSLTQDRDEVRVRTRWYVVYTCCVSFECSHACLACTR